MYIDVGDMRHCLDKAAELSEQYKLYIRQHEEYPRRTDDFVAIFDQYLAKPVVRRVIPISEALRSIRGFFIPFEDRYEIYLVEGMNYCWRRYVLCKEYFHAIIDGEDYRNMNIYSHLKEVSISFPELKSRPDSPVQSEMMAEIAALEFLFPYEERVSLVANGNMDFAGIAEHYKIPQFFVERYLSDEWMRYRGAFGHS